MRVTGYHSLAGYYVVISGDSAVHLIVAGIDYGVPGVEVKPWHYTYSIGTGTTPSPTG